MAWLLLGSFWSIMVMVSSIRSFFRGYERLGLGLLLVFSRV
jgi:hypothetical protein